MATIRSHLVVRKGLPLLDKINDVILRVRQSGLMSYWLYESQVHIKKSPVPDYEEVEGHLDLERIVSAVVLLGVGYVLSVVVFVLEMMYANFKALKINI